MLNKKGLTKAEQQRSLDPVIQRKTKKARKTCDVLMSRQDPQSYRRSLLRIPEEDAESAVGGPADAGAAGGHRICCCPVSAQQAQAFNQMMDFSLFRSVFNRNFLLFQIS